MKNRFLLLFLFCLLAVNSFADNFELPSPTKDEFIYFTADEVTYDDVSGVAALKGNVEIYVDDNVSKKVIRGTDIQIFSQEQLLISNGTTVIEDEKGIFTAQDIHFDIASRKLIMKEVSADYSPIRVLSDESVEIQDGKYVIRKATLTCCDNETPHYTIYVGKANLKPGDRIYATNAVLKIGKVPVFYLPFFYRSLNTDRLITSYIDFDQSGNTGFGFLTSHVLSLGNFRATANLDYYTKSGFGYGAQVAYDDPQKFRGSLMAYSIHDNNKGEDRWGINGGYWWEVYDSSDSLNNDNGGAIYFSQFETRNLSDADFNDDFFRADPYVVAPDKITRASIVRQSRASTLRIGYSNRRELDPDTKTYFNSEENLPKLDWIFTPFSIKQLGGLVNNVSFSLNNTKIENYDFVQYFQGRWVTSKDFKLHRNFTLTPSAFYDQQIILKDPTNDDKDKFVSRYGGQLNFRSDLVTGMLDIGYRYEKRTTSGSLTTDTDDFDGGEESNLIYIQNYYLPTPTTYFKVGTGYNLRNSLESWDVKERIEPILAEIGYFSPYSGTNVYVQNLYDVNSGNQAFVLDSTFRARADGNSINLGMVNYKTDRNNFLITSKFTLAPKNITWRADMGIDVSLNDSSFHAYSKHIRVYKDFHDVSIMVGVRDRNQNLSFTFRINVLCGASPKKETDERIDNYWYPWRDDRDVRGIY